MPGHKCCVPGCDKSGFVKHRFPVYFEEVFNTWIKRISLQKLVTLEPLDVYKRYLVCDRHFVEACKIPGSKKLKNYSLPSLYVPGFKEEPSTENSFFNNTTINNQSSTLIDHCYTSIIDDTLNELNKRDELPTNVKNPKVTNINTEEFVPYKICLKSISNLKAYPASTKRRLDQNSPNSTNVKEEIASKKPKLSSNNDNTSAKSSSDARLELIQILEGSIQEEQNLQSQSKVEDQENTNDDEIKIAETLRRLALLKKNRQANPPSKPFFKMSEEVGIVLQKAVTLDSKYCYSEAIIYYLKGIELLCNSMKNELDDVKKNYFKSKIKEYLCRAEKLKQILKEQEKYHEQIIIENDSTGHSYEKTFKKFLNSDVETVKIEDPYVRIFHQCQNLLMFCELLVKSCPNLKKIFLITTQASNRSESTDQDKWLNELKASLATHNINLDITYSYTLHDRQITLSNGWIIKIGRGLDYFKKSVGRFSLGSCDYDLRQCFETTIDIFNQKNLKQSFG